MKDFNKFGVTSTVMEGFAKGEWDAISVVSSITSDPVAAGRVLENRGFVKALVSLLSSSEAKVVHAAWAITANLSGIPGFGAALHSAGGFDKVQSTLNTSPPALQELIVTAVKQMCVADNMLAGILLTESMILKFSEFCCAHAEPALQKAAVFACADFFFRYPPFFTTFMGIGGMDTVMAAASSAQDPETRERAVFAATCAVSMNEASKNALSPAVIPIFTDTLFSAATDPARIHAAAGLGFVAAWLTPQDEAAILNSGSVLALVSTLSSCDSAPATQDINEIITRARLRKTALDTLGSLLTRSQACRAVALESSALAVATSALRSSCCSVGPESGLSEDAAAMTAALWKPSLVVLRWLLQGAEAAQAEFCAEGGMELLTKIGEREPEAKQGALALLADLSAKNPQAAAEYGKTGRIDEVIPLLGAQNPATRERAHGIVAGLAAQNPDDVTRVLVAKRAIPPVIATFISAPLDTPVKRDSLSIIAAAWLSGNSDALALLAKFQAFEHVPSVLTSRDSGIVVPALVVLSLAKMPEEKIAPGILTTDIALANLCRAATAEKKEKKHQKEEKSDDQEDGGSKKDAPSHLEAFLIDVDGKEERERKAASAEKLATQMALYILSVLIRKFPDAMRPHLCASDTVPRLFARLCAPGAPEEDTFDSTVGVLLLALRQGPEIRDHVLGTPAADLGLAALFGACQALPSPRAVNSAEVLSILASAPGRTFPILAEKAANYPLVAAALATAAAAAAATAGADGSNPTKQVTVRFLLVVLCAIIRSEGTRANVAGALGIDTFKALLSSADPVNSSLAISVAGALACTNAFRASQGAHAEEWAALLERALSDPRAPADEEASVRGLTVVVGFAPCGAFREAFCGREELMACISGAAANPFKARAQTLAIRALALLRAHAAARQLFDATVAQGQGNAGALAEALRFYANLPHEALWDLFGEDEKRVVALWEMRKINPSPASIISIFTICIKLAEDDDVRAKMAKVVAIDELARLAESFPFVADYAVTLKICLGF